MQGSRILGCARGRFKDLRSFGLAGFKENNLRCLASLLQTLHEASEHGYILSARVGNEVPCKQKQTAW